MNATSFLRGALALMAAGAVLPALAQNVPATVDRPVTISYYNYNLASTGIGAEATKRLIAQFQAANPNVKVDAVGANSAELTSRVQADAAAGRMPDVVQMVFSDLAFGVDNLGVAALEDIVPEEERKAHFAGMSPNGLKLGVLNGKTYGLAYTFSTPVLFYNADLFRQAGLDPDNPPKTWAEVKTAALAIAKKTKAAGIAAGIFGPSAGDWLFQGVLRSNNGSLLTEDRKTLSFAEPAAVEAVAMLRDLYDSGAYTNLEIDAAMEGMAAGKIGMYLQTSAIQGFLVRGAQGKFELRASTMPRFGEKPQRPNNSGRALVILSRDPLKRRAA